MNTMNERKALRTARVACGCALRVLMALLLCLNSIPRVGSAQIFGAPQKVGFQGRLTDLSNNPLNGTFSLTFSLYGVPSGGSPAWTETQPGMSVVNGAVDVTLGSVTPIPYAVAQSTESYLEIQVDAETLSPRQPLHAVLYSMNAAQFGGKLPSDFVDTTSAQSIAGGKSFTQTVQVSSHVNVAGTVAAAKFTGDGSMLSGVLATVLGDPIAVGTLTGKLGNTGVTITSNVYVTGGNVGIGTTVPAGPLDVVGNVLVSGVLRLEGDGKAPFELRLDNLVNATLDLDVSADIASDNRAMIGPATTGTDLAFKTGVERMRIRSNGWVGIGTTVPDAHLHVAGDDGAGANLYIQGLGTGGNVWRVQSTNNGAGQGGGKLVFRDNTTSTDSLILTGAGSVGIGTSAPSSKLDVAGTVTASAFSGNGVGLTGVTATGFSGTLSANKVSSGAFVGGDYAFPGKLAVSTNPASDAALAVFASPGATAITLDPPARTIDGVNASPALRFTSTYMTSGSPGTYTRSIYTTNPCPGCNTYMILDNGLTRLTLDSSAVKFKFDAAFPLSLESIFNSGTMSGTGDTDAMLTLQGHYWNGTSDTPRDARIIHDVSDAAPFSKLQLQVPAGVPRMTILDDGNVGIGTTNPQWPLHIAQSSSGPALRFDTPPGGSTNIGWYESGVARAFLQWDDTTNNMHFFTGGGSLGNIRMSIAEAGNVGIGTATPAQKLDVVGTVKATAFDGNGSALTSVSGTDASKVLKAGDTMTGLLTLSPASGNALVTTAGNVGIGTDAPVVDLHVEGPSNQFIMVRSANTTGDGKGPSLVTIAAVVTNTPPAGGVTEGQISYNNRLAFFGDVDGAGVAQPAITMVMTGDNKVGIGNFGATGTPPASKLSVLGGSSIGSGYGATAAPTDGLIVQGNVGIGTTNAPTPLYLYNANQSVAFVRAGGGAPTNAFESALQVENSGGKAVILGVGGPTNAGGFANMGLVLTDTNASGMIVGTQGTGSLSLRTGSSDKVKIDNSGNVGIGTTSPASILHVMGPSTLTRIVNDVVAGGEADYAFAVAGTLNGVLAYRNDLTPNSLDFFVGGITGANKKMTINTNGDVGIGTATPAQKLDVAGTVKATAFDGNGSALTSVSGTDVTKVLKAGDTMTGLLTLSPASGNALVTTAGNVGIGTTVPSTRLHISGFGGGSNPAGSGVFVDEDAGGNPRIELRKSGGSPYIDFATNVASDNDARIILQAGYFKIHSGGVDRINVNVTDGNVGIGTVTPAQKLDVAGTVKATAFEGNGSALTSVSDTTKVLKAGDTMTGLLTLSPASGNALVTTAGNVGIGTTSPGTALEVRGSASDVFQWGNATQVLGMLTGGTVGAELSAIVKAPTGSGVTFQTSGIYAMSVKSNGNVGIGTATPGQRLTVVGAGAGTVTGFTGQLAQLITGSEDYVFGQNAAITGSADGNSVLLSVAHTAANSTPLEMLSFRFRNNADTGSYEGARIRVRKASGSNIGIMDFYTANVGTANQVMTLDQTGRLGIGAASPFNRLDVAGSAAIGTGYAGSATAPTDGLIVKGDVGIGTITPSTKLHVEGTQNSGLYIAVRNLSNGTSADGGVLFGNDVALDAGEFFVTSSGNAGGANILSFGNTVGGPIRFRTGGTQRLRIEANGDVGIGTASPTGTLTVDGGTAAAATAGSVITLKAQTGGAGGGSPGGAGGHIVLLPGMGGTGTPPGAQGNVGIGTGIPGARFDVVGAAAIPGVRLTNFDATSGKPEILSRASRGGGTPAAVTTNDALMLLGGAGYGDTVFSGPQGQIGIFANQLWTDATHGTYMSFATTQNGFSTLTERMRIGNDGNIGMGAVPSATEALLIQRTSPGARVSAAVSNADNTNAASGARLAVATGGGAAGDPFMCTTVAGVSDWCLGTDNSDSQKFKIASTDGLGLGSDRLVIDTSGNVGIGTTSPGEPLHVERSAGALNIASFINPTNSAETSIYIGQTLASGRAGRIAFQDNIDATSGYIFLGNFGDALGTGGLVVKKGGNVGIGTTSPQALLHVAGAGGLALQLDGSSVQEYINYTNTIGGGALYFLENGVLRGSLNQEGSTNGDVTRRRGFILQTSNDPASFIAFSPQNTEQMRITAAGNVGIGTMAPKSRLQVNGDLGLGDGAPVGNQPVTVFLTNTSGVTLAQGDIVIAGGADNSFTTTTIPGAKVIGVVYDASVPNGVVGRIAVAGVALVRTDGTAVSPGDHVETSTLVGGQAKAVITPTNGGSSIGVWLEAAGVGPSVLRRALLR